MALPPCHILAQFNVMDGNKLSCSLYQRSGDVGLGVPFNIASYSLLTHLIAKHCGLIATDFYYHLGNCHIYDDHENQLTEQIQRTPFAFPTINIKNIKEKLDDYSLDDIEIFDYVSYENIKMEMRK
jgi:thymidylate synthase